MSGSDASAGNDAPEAHPDTDEGTAADATEQPPATRLPADAEPWRCPYCGFQLPEEQQYRLHLGLEHYSRLDDADRERFTSAYSEEEAALDRFRIIALGGLVLLYFGFLLVYAVLAA